jgi:hypothetical protein
VRAAATRAALAAAASRASALTNVLSGVGGRGRGTRAGGGAVRVVCSSAAVNCTLSSLLSTLPTSASASRRGAAAACRLAGREASLLRARVASPMTAASSAVHSSRWPSAAAVPSTDSTARPSNASSRTSTSKLWLRASASLGRRWMPGSWPPPSKRSVAATSTDVRDSTPRAASGEATCTRKPARRSASFV